MKFKNPLGFYQGPVTVVICAVYIAIVAGLLYVHHVLPSAPKKAVPFVGINVTEAWRDLQHVSTGSHPYNSHRNDEVRSWLLTRVMEILNHGHANGTLHESGSISRQDLGAEKKASLPVTVFNDTTSNITFTGAHGMSVYFEGTNIIVYIRGSEDGNEDWWRHPEIDDEGKPRGVLVSAHYDSVATGLGATDDGVGIVSILQLIKYYITTGHKPKRGLVALLNNGEEDSLNGAMAFSQHPIARFPDRFLNLEGAGAGGRATLFRSTDAEVTKAYRKSARPFGTVLSSDAFDRGLIRSQTDYVIFNGVLGMRGLDVAFFEPRARYHTAEDSARHTSRDSLWHMLSAAIATTKDLTSNTSTDFDSDEGSNGVWFDLFGRAFGLFTLDGLFGLSVALLVVTPLLLAGLVTALQRTDKMYLIARKAHSNPLDPHSPDESAVIEFGGWRGFARFPIAFVLASVATVALAFWVAKINPLIVYSSQYAVWSMLLSAWLIIAWFILKGSDQIRPSALQRAHTLGWLFFIMWVVLVASTALENIRHIAGVYPVAIYLATVFMALSVSYIEFFALPKKQAYIEEVSRADEPEPASPAPRSRHRQSSISSSRVIGCNEDDRPRSSRNDPRPSHDNEDPTVFTSLLSHKRPRSQGQASRTAQSRDEHLTSRVQRSLPYHNEQPWSAHLPSSLWLLQFLILAPINLVILGPIALFLTTALHQTPADGSSALFIYASLAGLSVLLLLPTTPFLHRLSSRVPLFLLCVLIGTTIYNLTAFPFSESNRLKVFFRQDLDVETGVNEVLLTGIDGYVQKIAEALPSVGGQELRCGDPELEKHNGLVTCRWRGLPPNTVHERNVPSLKQMSAEERYRKWVHVDVSRSNLTEGSAKITVGGKETKACRLLFDSPIADFHVKGASKQEKRVKEGGTKEVRLWSREWENTWTVDVKWDSTDGTDAASGGVEVAKGNNATLGLHGRAACQWSDANQPGFIPAYDELRLNMPIWSVVTKMDDGLVTGYKRFVV